VNNSGKPHRSGLNLVHTQVKGCQCPEDLGRDRPSGVKMWLRRLQRSQIFCHQHNMTFWQFPDGWFSTNLSTTRESVSPRKVSNGFLKIFRQTEQNVQTNRLIFIARQHTDAIYWYSKSVRLSVRLSVSYVLVSDENFLTYRHSFFTVR